MVGVTPQSSVAITLFVLVSQPGMLAGLHPKFRLIGHLVSTGRSVSTVQVIVCVQVLVLPQASVAVYTSVRVCVHPLAVSTLLHVMIGVLHVSLAATLLALVSQSGMT